MISFSFILLENFTKLWVKRLRQNIMKQFWFNFHELSNDIQLLVEDIFVERVFLYKIVLPANNCFFTTLVCPANLNWTTPLALAEASGCFGLLQKVKIVQTRISGHSVNGQFWKTTLFRANSKFYIFKPKLVNSNTILLLLQVPGKFIWAKTFFCKTFQGRALPRVYFMLNLQPPESFLRVFYVRCIHTKMGNNSETIS